MSHINKLLIQFKTNIICHRLDKLLEQFIIMVIRRHRNFFCSYYTISDGYQAMLFMKILNSTFRLEPFVEEATARFIFFARIVLE